MCVEKVSFGSKLRPRIKGKGLVASRSLFIERLSDLEYSAGSGVKRVVCVLLVFSLRLLSMAQLVILFR